MIVQYPHILRFTIVTDAVPYEDSNGDTVIPVGTAGVFEIKCRFETNSKGSTIPSNDGENVIYSWMIYMPLNQIDIPKRIDVVGLNKGVEFAKGTVLNFSRDQLNARAWV
ncbi:hypothetical protein [Pedobacter metabolipauper]|nr:hypothetical protein [Pedobacter metabolipauper]